MAQAKPSWSAAPTTRSSTRPPATTRNRRLQTPSTNRQSALGKYGRAEHHATILAGEIGSGTVYDALHKRVANNNFAGLRIGDFLDVSMVSASAVTSQQSVRFLLAHVDPYLWCDDRSKGHHLAFVSSAPIAVSSTYPDVVNGSCVQWNKTNANQGTADEKHPYLASSLKVWENAFEGCLPENLYSTCSRSACCWRNAIARPARSQTPTPGAGPISARCSRCPRRRSMERACGAPRDTASALIASGTSSMIQLIA